MIQLAYRIRFRIGRSEDLFVVEQNPVTITQKSKERGKWWDCWTTGDECSRYLEAAKKENLSFYVFACLALNTGCRSGEIIALEHQDVDLERRRIRIWRILEYVTGEVVERTKGFTERWLGINDSLHEALTFHRANTKHQRPSSPLICYDNGLRIDQHGMRVIHLKVCKKAGVKPIRVHDLRHTFASHFIMNGGSLTELQGLLGHSSPAMTLKYAHMAPGFLESRASVVAFSANGPRSKFKIVGSSDE
jgi:integrase